MIAKFHRTSAEARSEQPAPNTFEVGKPAPYFCPACQAVPRAGYCKLDGCPTAPTPPKAEAGPMRTPLAEPVDGCWYPVEQCTLPHCDCDERSKARPE